MSQNECLVYIRKRVCSNDLFYIFILYHFGLRANTPNLARFIVCFFFLRAALFGSALAKGASKADAAVAEKAFSLLFMFGSVLFSELLLLFWGKTKI